MYHRANIAAIALTLSGTTALLNAGDLNPPPGPITPTHKTLTQIEPRIAINAANTPGDADSAFRITQSGSYYLTSNIILTSPIRGIEIAANFVTIDLNGFTITGGLGFGLEGITLVAPNPRGINIRNGLIVAVGANGILLPGEAHRISNISVLYCQGDGIVLGNGCTAEHCITTGNVGDGLSVSANTTLTSCISTLNNSNGFVSGNACTLTNCTAARNAARGFSNVLGGSGTFTNCNAEENQDNGFHGFGAYALHNCTARLNAGYGFFFGQENSSLTNCTARDNDFTGIFVLAGTVTGCSAVGNGAVTNSPGIDLSFGVVSNCYASANAANGIEVDSGIVTGNHAAHNGTQVADGAGIRVTRDTRVEANNTEENDVGIEAIASGNVIIRNTCTGNANNFLFVAGNLHGPIIDRTSPVAPAVSGNSAPGTLSSTDPNANYAY